MGCLKQKNTRPIFDPTYTDVDHNSFHRCDWKECNGDVQEVIPADMPRPLDKDVELCMMVDSDHTGNKQTRQSRTGFLIFCNLALIDQVSMMQLTIESSELRQVRLLNGVWAWKLSPTPKQ